MSPLEEKLSQFVEDEVMYEAVRSVLLSMCDMNTLTNDVPNAELGEKARAFLQAREIITKAYKEMERYRKHKTGNQSVGNPAF